MPRWYLGSVSSSQGSSSSSSSFSSIIVICRDNNNLEGVAFKGVGKLLIAIFFIAEDVIVSASSASITGDDDDEGLDLDNLLDFDDDGITRRGEVEEDND